MGLCGDGGPRKIRVQGECLSDGGLPGWLSLVCRGCLVDTRVVVSGTSGRQSDLVIVSLVRVRVV